MGFDLKKFKHAQFEPRTEAVAVPDLKEWFADGAEALWTVRNLTGHELGTVNEAAERNRNLAAIVEQVVAQGSREKADAINQLVGMDNSTPQDIVRRLEMLTIGSVDPVIDHELAVKLCAHFPIEFMLLTNAISRLTGQGAQVKKKQPASGPTPT